MKWLERLKEGVKAFLEGRGGAKGVSSTSSTAAREAARLDPRTQGSAKTFGKSSLTGPTRRGRTLPWTTSVEDDAGSRAERGEAEALAEGVLRRSTPASVQSHPSREGHESNFGMLMPASVIWFM
jgi:hypothetical protein